MPFFPDSIYGLIYLGALILFGIITLRGPNRKAWRILAVLTVHWIFLRAIYVYDKDNFILWLIHDYVFYGALLACGGGIAALVCAGLFLIMVAFDSYSLIMEGTFEGASSVAEVIGIICMAIMAGSAHGGTDGKLARHSHLVRSRIGGMVHLGKAWLASKTHSRSDSGIAP